jgi:hypothetical protein
MHPTGGELVRFSCGNDVAAYTVAISIDDGTGSASADFTIYLVLREAGWKSGERTEAHLVEDATSGSRAVFQRR